MERKGAVQFTHARRPSLSLTERQVIKGCSFLLGIGHMFYIPTAYWHRMNSLLVAQLTLFILFKFCYFLNQAEKNGKYVGKQG